MKTTMLVLTAFLAISNANAQSKSMQVQIYGTRMVPKQVDYDLVRNTIGSLIADLSVKKYVLQATGIEGGFTACLVPNGDRGYNEMIVKLTTIEVDRNETSYQIQFVDKCADQEL